MGGDGFLARNKFVKLRKGAKKSIEYFNIYGTSEVSAWASIHRVSEKDWVRNDIPLDSDWLPIGEELSGTVMEVRDEFGDVVTSGYGELFIGQYTSRFHPIKHFLVQTVLNRFVNLSQKPVFVIPR